MKNQIAVIVPIYNAEKYIDKCVLSITEQTYKDLDIILVDDGSSDRSLQVCKRLRDKDNRIRVIHKENGGPTSARCLGVASTEADLIMFVDADDFIMPTMCERLHCVMATQGVDMVASGIIRYYSDGDCKYEYNFIAPGKYESEAYQKMILPHMLCCGVSYRRGIDASLAIKIFRKDLLNPIIRRAKAEYGYHFEEDTAVVYPYMLEANSVYILHECFYYHRQSDNHLSVYVDDMDFEKKLAKLYQYLKNIFSEYEEEAILIRQLDSYMCGVIHMKYIHIAKTIVSKLPNMDRYLFPFQRITKGCKILLYGAGDVGQSYYAQLMKLRFCESIVWQDRNYREYQKIGLPVQKADMSVNVDYCVIAVQDEHLAGTIKNELLSLGMGEDKIIWECPLLNMW